MSTDPTERLSHARSSPAAGRHSPSKDGRASQRPMHAPRHRPGRRRLAAVSAPGRADEAAGCGPLAATQALVARLGGGALEPASEAQTEFLRAALIGEPGADASALYAGVTLLASLADGGAAAVYAVDGRACGLIVLGPGWRRCWRRSAARRPRMSGPRYERPRLLAGIAALACLRHARRPRPAGALPVAFDLRGRLAAGSGGALRPLPPRRAGRRRLRAPGWRPRCDRRRRGMALGRRIWSPRRRATSARASSPACPAPGAPTRSASGSRAPDVRRWRTGWRRARFATGRMSPAASRRSRRHGDAARRRRARRIVAGVAAGGSIEIISGNWGRRVARAVIPRGDVTAFVRP